MGYLKIPNLYREPQVLECYALEKIHGTSAHIAWQDGQLRFFSGGEHPHNFEALFDRETLTEKFSQIDIQSGSPQTIIVYGEAFGGRQQNMRETYGATLRFMCFDVKKNGFWLDVPRAEALVKSLGLGFVPYERIPFSIEFLDRERDRDSLVAIKPGCMREGIVIRPIHEDVKNNGERKRWKHKRPEFRETKTPREVDPNRAIILSEAKQVAEEWVTLMRLNHVLQKTPYNSEKDTGAVIRAMIEDVRVESEGEVIWSKDVEKAIGRATVALLQSGSFNND